MIIGLTNKKLFKLRKFHRRRKSHEGFTLVELIIVMALIGIMAALSIPHISFGNNPLQDRTNRMAGTFKLVRTKAVAQTSAYRVSQESVTKLKVERNKSCFIPDGDVINPWTIDPGFTNEDLSLNEAVDVQGIAKNADVQFTNATVTNPNGTVVTPWTSWKICYDSRGITSANLFLFLKDMKTQKGKAIEIFSAGGTQVYDP